MAVQTLPFQIPVPGNTVSVTPAGASASVALPTTNADYSQMLIYNGTGADAFIELGGSGVTASTSTSMPVAPGDEIIVTIPRQAGTVTYAAAKLASNVAGKVYFTCSIGD
jgi:hypothetical protein